MVLNTIPCTGKTYGLTALLGFALSEGIPAMMMVSPTAALIFENQVVELVDVFNSHPLLSGRALVLCASDYTMPTLPAVLASTVCELYVVQATSASTGRWRDWAEEKRAMVWVLDVWKESEVALTLYEKFLSPQGHQFDILLQYRKLYDRPRSTIDRYHPLEIYRIIGPSARQIFGGSRPRTEGGQEKDFNIAISGILVNNDKFLQVLHDGVSLNGLYTNFESVFIARPINQNPRSNYDNLVYHYIPSQCPKH